MPGLPVERFVKIVQKKTDLSLQNHMVGHVSVCQNERSSSMVDDLAVRCLA